MDRYEIQFNNGITLVTYDHDVAMQYVNGGDVTFVAHTAPGECLHDENDERACERLLDIIMARPIADDHALPFNCR